MSFALRPYQAKGIQEIRDQLAAGKRRVLYQLPTGGGKTSITAFMMGSAARRNMSSFFIVHRRELLRQASETFWRVGIQHGKIEAGGRGISHDPIQVASIDSLLTRMGKVRMPDVRMLVFDEAHHVVAGKWQKLIEAFPRAYIIGLTATPQRADGKGLADDFDVMVKGPTVRELTDDGFLVPATVFAPPLDVDLKGLATRFGDYAQGALAERMDKPQIIGDTVQHYRRIAHGTRAIAFCVSVDHSRHVAREFAAAGYRAAHVDGSMDVRERDGLIAAFGRGDIEVLTNCDLVSEGFDVPALETAILLRPTKSLGLYLQQVGRALRTMPGKSRALILDHAGNVLRHGMPDQHREWTLKGDPLAKGRSQAEREQEIEVIRCPACFAAHLPMPRCPGCGHVYEATPRQLKQGEGELQQVDQAAVEAAQRAIRERRIAEERAAGSIEALVQLGRARGYRYPERWAHHRWGNRRVG